MPACLSSAPPLFILVVNNDEHVCGAPYIVCTFSNHLLNHFIQPSFSDQPPKSVPNPNFLFRLTLPSFKLFHTPSQTIFQSLKPHLKLNLLMVLSLSNSFFSLISFISLPFKHFSSLLPAILQLLTLKSLFHKTSIF